MIILPLISLITKRATFARLAVRYMTPTRVHCHQAKVMFCLRVPCYAQRLGGDGLGFSRPVLDVSVATGWKHVAFSKRGFCNVALSRNSRTQSRHIMKA